MLQTITELSHTYGSDKQFVLAGGGNTSCKDDKYLYVKPSGVSLAKIKPEDFVKMDRAILRQCFEWGDIADKSVREERIKKLMAYSVVAGERRASVEAPLHELMPFTYVVHTHPVLVNGMTCGKDGKAVCAQLFPTALWVDYCDPGFTLAKVVFEAAAEYKKANGVAPQVIFLQNHGVFVGADTADEIDALYSKIILTLHEYYQEKGVALELQKGEAADIETIREYAPKLRAWLGDGNVVTVTSSAPFSIARGPLSPDHLVYAKAFGLISDAPTREAVDAFKAEHGYLPRMVEIPGKALFCAGKNKANADTVLQLVENGALIEQLSQAFGGINYLTDAQRSFIENWEVESYRAKVAAGGNAGLTGTVAVVTGGAQGFGYGIAQYLAKQGADIVVADMNVEGAQKAAEQLGAGAL